MYEILRNKLVIDKLRIFYFVNGWTHAEVKQYSFRPFFGGCVFTDFEILEEVFER